MKFHDKVTPSFCSERLPFPVFSLCQDRLAVPIGRLNAHSHLYNDPILPRAKEGTHDKKINKDESN